MDYAVITVIVRTLGVGLVAVLIALAKHYIDVFNVKDLVIKLVNAAEILFDVPKSGDQKKAWVKEKLKGVFKFKWLSDDVIDILIEAAVAELKRKE